MLALKGTHPRVKTRLGRYSQRVNVFISMSRSGQVVVTLTQGLTAQMTLFHLAALRKVCSSSQLTILWDGNGNHRALSVLTFCLQHQIECITFPPYSPELNPIEELNRQLKLFLANRIFWSVSVLKTAIHRFFQRHNYQFPLRIETYLQPAPTNGSLLSSSSESSFPEVVAPFDNFYRFISYVA